MGNSSDETTNAQAHTEQPTNNVVEVSAWAQARSRLRHPSTSVDDSTPPELTDHSPSGLWRADFEVHQGQHADVNTSGMWVLAPVVESALRRSLPVFQLGETGAGFHLLNQARDVVSNDLLCALRLFVIEEQEHARLHALVCQALDIPMLDDHWSERLFRRVRRVRGLRLELLMMLIAEFVAVDVYETLSDGVGDPTLSRIFARMHADELRHLEFLAAVIPPHLERLPVPVRTLTRQAWRALATVAVVVISIEHRALLRSCGSGIRHFTNKTLSTIGSQQFRFFGDPTESSSPRH